MSRGSVRLSLVGAVAACATLVAPATGAAAPRYDVTVTRTEFGIPHIQAKDLRSAGYGYAKALAEDAVCVVAESYVTVNAERSKHFGEDGRYTIRGNGSSANNLNSDLFYQRIIDTERVEKLVAQEPPIGPRPEIREALGSFLERFAEEAAAP